MGDAQNMSGECYTLENIHVIPDRVDAANRC